MKRKQLVWCAAWRSCRPVFHVSSFNFQTAEIKRKKWTNITSTCVILASTAGIIFESVNVSEFFGSPHLHTTPLYSLSLSHSFCDSIIFTIFFLLKNIFFAFQFITHHSFHTFKAPLFFSFSRACKYLQPKKKHQSGFSLFFILFCFFFFAFCCGVFFFPVWISLDFSKNQPCYGFCSSWWYHQ